MYACVFSFRLGRFVNDDVEGRRTRGASTVWRTERYATAIRKSNRIFRRAVFLSGNIMSFENILVAFARRIYRRENVDVRVRQ